MRYRDDDFYEKMGCHVIYDKTVTEICAEKKQVIIDDGKVIDYDKLLVSTGSSPFVPNFSGLETVEEKFTFMSLDDAKSLEKALDEDKKVLIIGAGLIGLKCAEGILNKVKTVTVIDLAPNILSSILDKEGSALVQKHLESKGMEFKLSSGLESFNEKKALLNNGETIDFDILVLAVGVRPNTSLLSGIAKIDRGIVVNGKSETTVHDIYAAGDCTQTYDVSSHQNRIMALLPNAYMQGECAGINMAGGDASFEKSIPMNAIGFFGLHIITAGSYLGEVYAENNNNSYKRMFFGDNNLNGYILIGNVEKAGIYTNLIREQTPLSSIDFPLICEKPGLMAFTKEVRNQKLGGVSI